MEGYQICVNIKSDTRELIAILKMLLFLIHLLSTQMLSILFIYFYFVACYHCFFSFEFYHFESKFKLKKFFSIKLKNCQIEKSSNWRVIMIAPMKMVLHHFWCNYDSEFHLNYKFTSALVQLSRFVANIWRSLSLVYWMMDALSDLSSNTAPGRTKRKKKLRKFSRKFDNFDQSTIIFQMSSQLHDYVFISK